tara:strand:- start:94 stop:978 length:885 start_codon:yes stop_codon:yes gene_type:complete
MDNFSPLRYPGGKNKLSRYLKKVIEQNELIGSDYIEPFAGGSGVALSLLLSEYVRDIHIYDLDIGVYSFWNSVKCSNDQLCELIQKTPVNIETWLRFREEYSNPEGLSELELGFRAFYLNRTNRSGILKAGVIGGINQDGNYKIDARFKKDNLIKRIRKIGLYSSRINVYNLHIDEFLTEEVPKLSQHCFIYFDPPYYEKADGLYQNHFKHQDHESLSLQIRSIVDHDWVVSYDNVAPILDLYKGVDYEIFGINYSADSHYKGSEVMFFKDGTKRPDRVFTSKKEELELLKECI